MDQSSGEGTRNTVGVCFFTNYVIKENLHLPHCNADWEISSSFTYFLGFFYFSTHSLENKFLR